MPYGVIGNTVFVSSLSGLNITKIPDELHPLYEGCTHANSFATETGVDPRSELAISNTSSMAARIGVDRYYLEDVMNNAPEFGFMYRSKRFYTTYVNSFDSAWDSYQFRMNVERKVRAKNNF